MSRCVFAGLAAVGVATLTTAAYGSDETIVDDAFDEADWTLVELRDETSSDSAGFIGVQQSTGGNPGAYRFVANSWAHDGNGSVSVVGGHLRAAADYQPPAQGAIGTVAFAFDVRTNATTYQTESLLAFFPLIFQSDAYYVASHGAEGTDGWGEFSSGPLNAEDFTRLAGDGQAPTTPDFSAAGAPLSFGFAASVGPHALAGTYSTEGGLDNFTVEIRMPGAGGTGGAGGAEGGGGAGGSSSPGSGTLPSGDPGTPVARDAGGCGCRLEAGAAKAPPAGVPWLVLLGLALSAATRGRARHARQRHSGRAELRRRARVQYSSD